MDELNRRKSLYLKARDNHSDPLFYLTAAAHFAWLNPYQFADAELDQRLVGLASPLAKSYQPIPDRIVHVTSGILDSGAHTKMILHWLSVLGGDQHVISSEWWNSSKEGPKNLTQIKELAQSVWLGEKQTPQVRVKQLRDRLITLRPEKIMLHTNPSDVIALVSVLAARPSMLLFSDHADHTFSIGVTLVDRLIAFRPIGADMAVQLKGIAPEKISLVPLESTIRSIKPISREELNIPADSTVSITIVGLYKLKPNSHWNFGEVMRGVLQSPNHYHLLVGGGSIEIKNEINQVCDNPRLRWLGQRNDIADLLAISDFAIDGCPQSGGMFRLDAAKFGLPIVAITAYDFPSLNIFDMGVLPNDYPLCRTNEEMIKRATELINNKELRLKLGAEVKSIYDAQTNSIERMMHAALTDHQSWQVRSSHPTGDDINHYLLKFFHEHVSWGWLMYSMRYVLGYLPKGEKKHAVVYRVKNGLHRRLRRIFA